MKVAPLAVAAALTSVVLLHPGGPCSSTPLQCKSGRQASRQEGGQAGTSHIPSAEASIERAALGGYCGSPQQPTTRGAIRFCSRTWVPTGPGAGKRLHASAATPPPACGAANSRRWIADHYQAQGPRYWLLIGGNWAARGEGSLGQGSMQRKGPSLENSLTTHLSFFFTASSPPMSSQLQEGSRAGAAAAGMISAGSWHQMHASAAALPPCTNCRRRDISSRRRSSNGCRVLMR